MQTAGFKRKKDWIRSYCKAVLYERYSEKSAETLWKIFLRTKNRGQITTEDGKAMNRCCKRLDIESLVNRICSYVPEGHLSIGLFEEEINGLRIVEMVLTAANLSGHTESFSLKVKEAQQNSHGKMNRFEFHKGLRDFLCSMAGESAYMFGISKLTTVIREEGKRLCEWYNENVRNEDKK